MNADMQSGRPRLGLALQPSPAFSFAELRALAHEAETLGYDALWVPEVGGPDVFTTLAVYAAATSRVGLATGVIPIQTRTPPVLAMSFASLHALSGGRAIAGLGVSSTIIVEQWHGARYPPPLAATRDCVAIMREIFTAGKCAYEGKAYQAKGFRLGFPMPSPPPKIFLAGLNPGMLRLAGAIADGVLLNYTPPQHIGARIAEVRRGAEAAGRKAEDVITACYVRCCVTADEASAVAAFQRELGSYAFVPAYVQMFGRFGFGDQFAAFQRLWREGRRDEAPGAFSEATVRAIAAIGPAERARAFIEEFRKVGLDYPILFPVGPGRTTREHIPGTVRALRP
jgi:probable F420-dependent oxidoreductase